MPLSDAQLQILDCESTPFTPDQITKFSAILKLEQGSEKAGLLRALNPTEKDCFTKEFVPYLQLCQNIKEYEQRSAAMDKQIAALDATIAANLAAKTSLRK